MPTRIADPASPVHLLLIEDDEDDYILTREFLEDIFINQFVLEWVNTPEKARDVMAQNRHDLCLMDFHLGPSDGIELLKHARSVGFLAPVIMLTGQEDLQTDAMALRHGAVDYLSKQNLTSRTLARAVRYALSRRDMEIERLERIRAETENRSKTTFLAHLSHELRTPLAAILGYTDVMLSEAPDEKSRQSLMTIRRNSIHLRSLLNDVLDLSKIESGNLEIEISSLSLSTFLAELYDMMVVTARDRGLTLKFSSVGDIPEVIHSDSVRLRQILINLLSNAIKFSEKGTIDLRLQIVVVEGQERLIFDVIDQGPGIRAQDLGRLFQPFSRLNNDSSGAEGTGLGLNISRQLAQRLGGDISVSSQPGIGSTFRLTIDAGLENKSKRQPLSPELFQVLPKASALPTLTGIVLIVEDNSDLRNLLRIWLEPTGLTVIEAENGRQAIDRVTSASASGSPIDLILMDMQMPVMNGLESTQKIRMLGFEIPIIALTAGAMKGEREIIIASGCSEFLSKPVKKSLLLQSIRSFLNLSSTEAPRAPLDYPPQILLVEDNRDAAEATSSLLECLGWTVTVAANGRSALEQVTSMLPSLVLLDMNLPDITGVELAPRLRARLPQGTPIIALSGESLSREFCSRHDIDRALLKPVDLATLKTLSEITLVNHDASQQ